MGSNNRMVWKEKEMNQLLSHPSFFPEGRLVHLGGVLIYANDKYYIEINKGYRSDGGSLPRISWSILGITPTDGRCLYAFIVHDFLYQTHLIARSEADAILNEILAIPPRCNKVQRWLIYEHVRAYGWIPYWSKDDETINAGLKMGRLQYV